MMGNHIRQPRHLQQKQQLKHRYGALQIFYFIIFLLYITTTVKISSAAVIKREIENVTTSTKSASIVITTTAATSAAPATTTTVTIPPPSSSATTEAIVSSPSSPSPSSPSPSVVSVTTITAPINNKAENLTQSAQENSVINDVSAPLERLVDGERVEGVPDHGVDGNQTSDIIVTTTEDVELATYKPYKFDLSRYTSNYNQDHEDETKNINDKSTKSASTSTSSFNYPDATSDYEKMFAHIRLTTPNTPEFDDVHKSYRRHDDGENDEETVEENASDDDEIVERINKSMIDTEEDHNKVLDSNINDNSTNEKNSSVFYNNAEIESNNYDTNTNELRKNIIVPVDNNSTNIVPNNGAGEKRGKYLKHPERGAIIDAHTGDLLENSFSKSDLNLSIPNTAEVWALAGMKSVEQIAGRTGQFYNLTSERHQSGQKNVSDSTKLLADWSEIMKNNEFHNNTYVNSEDNIVDKPDTEKSNGIVAVKGSQKDGEEQMEVENKMIAVLVTAPPPPPFKYKSRNNNNNIEDDLIEVLSTTSNLYVPLEKNQKIVLESTTNRAFINNNDDELISTTQADDLSFYEKNTLPTDESFNVEKKTNAHQQPYNVDNWSTTTATLTPSSFLTSTPDWENFDSTTTQIDVTTTVDDETTLDVFTTIDPLNTESSVVTTIRHGISIDDDVVSSTFFNDFKTTTTQSTTKSVDFENGEKHSSSTFTTIATNNIEEIDELTTTENNFIVKEIVSSTLKVPTNEIVPLTSTTPSVATTVTTTTTTTSIKITPTTTANYPSSTLSENDSLKGMTTIATEINQEPSSSAEPSVTQPFKSFTDTPQKLDISMETNLTELVTEPIKRINDTKNMAYESTTIPSTTVVTKTTIYPEIKNEIDKDKYNVNTNENNEKVEVMEHQPNDDFATEGNIELDENTTNLPGETGDYEQPKDDGPDVNAIIAITVSVIGVIALVLLVGFLLVIRKRQKQLTYGQRCRPVGLDAYSLDNVSVFNSVRRKPNNLRLSKRSYGNSAFEDPGLRCNLLTIPALETFIENKNSIYEEFKELPQVTARSDEVPQGCEDKNRYANVVPLPETRVHLQQLNADEKTEYINANYVKGPKDPTNYYIACQAPMENTITDFWRMIWEQNSKVIIMATDLTENGIEKCAEYLPPSAVLDCNRTFGDFHVTLKNREVKEKYAVSTIHLKNAITNTWREIIHFWYQWPESGMPNDEASVIAMLLEARSYLKMSMPEQSDDNGNDTLTALVVENGNNGEVGGGGGGDAGAGAGGGNGGGNENGKVTNGTIDKSKSLQRGQGPLTVHCSPGTGRTGTLIACDIALRTLEMPARSLDLPQIVYYVRRGRALAVRTREQYEFIYKVAYVYATKLTGPIVEN